MYHVIFENRDILILCGNVRIRDKYDYLKIWGYIDTNPAKWQQDNIIVKKRLRLKSFFNVFIEKFILLIYNFCEVILLKIFDFHMHVGYDFNGKSGNSREYLNTLKNVGITRCAGCAIDMACNAQPIENYGDIIKRLNAHAYDIEEQYPDFYTAGVHVHPDFVDLSCEIMREHKSRGGLLVGELVYYMMGYQYDHAGLYEIFSYADELGMVVSLHPSSKRYSDMEKLLTSFPNLKIVIAHLDGYGLFDSVIDLMKKYPNMYTDISAYGATREGMLTDAVSKIGSDRILFGTDFPGYQIQPFIDAVLKSGLSDTDIDNIMYNNASKLLKVK